MRQSGGRLAETLGPLTDDGPLYRQLADALKAAIDRGEIAFGTALPPERALAEALSVSRSTVVTAYDRLKTEGWLASQQGSGTWVRTPDEAQGGVDAVATAPLFLDQPAEAATAPDPGAVGEDVADLSVASVLGTPTVGSLLASLTPDDLAPMLGHHGYLPHGLATLRTIVARRFDDAGLPTDPDAVVVTNGAHQAMSLVARQTIEPGDPVVVESPTFPGMLDIVRRFGARAIPLPLDQDGARADVLDDLVTRMRPKLVFVTPHFHNPTGTVMSETRRQHIARIADDSGTPVIEDLVLADLAIDDTDLPAPLAAHSEDRNVHTISSASKLCWAGLRIGWVRSPEAWHTRMLSTKTVADLGTSLVGQLQAARLLEHADQIRDERRAQLRAGRDLLCDLLEDHLPDWQWQRPAGGLSLWVHLPRGNADEFADHAHNHGVRIIPGSSLSVDHGNRRAIRLVYARPTPVIEQAVQRLTTAWEDYHPTDTRSPARLLV